MSSTASHRRTLLRVTGGYALVWLAGQLLWRVWIGAPRPLLAALFLPALALGGWWLWSLRDARGRTARLVSWVASAAFLVGWQLAVFLFDWLGWREARDSFLQIGAGGLFLIGLAWVIWFLERAARRFESARIEEHLRQEGLAIDLAPRPSAAIKSQPRAKTIWQPLDPDAWYYGRGSRKLKQSLVALTAYTLAFWLAAVLLSSLRGCGGADQYELPAGGGKQVAVAQMVKIQKVIRKKYIINPLSAIKFDVPPIDDIKLQLTEVTKHAYTIGYGEGTGAGFAGGTSQGKVRFIRLEYDGGDWDQDFGIGGDMNMLFEYGMLTQQKVAEKTESRRIAQLAGFPAEKSPPLVYLTGQGNISVSNAEVKILREYLLEKHGLLFGDNGGSAHFHGQFLALMNRVLPEIRPVPVPLDDTLHRVPFQIATFPYVAPHGGKEALGWSVDGRWVAYYHPGDIGDAWSDGHAGVAPDVYNACYQLGANVINYAHSEYAKWLMSRQKK